MAYAIQNILARRAEQPMQQQVLPLDEPPLPGGMPPAMAGKKCSECGAHAVIRKDAAITAHNAGIWELRLMEREVSDVMDAGNAGGMAMGSTRLRRGCAAGLMQRRQTVLPKRLEAPGPDDGPAGRHRRRGRPVARPWPLLPWRLVLVPEAARPRAGRCLRPRR